MKTSFASPERVPQHAICHRGIVRSQTAGYPDIRNGTRSSHPNRIGSRPSIEFHPVARRTPSTMATVCGHGLALFLPCAFRARRLIQSKEKVK